MTAKQSDSHNDFYQQLVNRRKPQPLTEESLQEAQSNWSKLQPGNQKTEQLFPAYFFEGFWIRMWAFFIDLVCVRAISVATIGFLVRFQLVEQSDSLLSVYGLLAAVIYYGYFILMTKCNYGQTVGKMIFGIRVVSLEEEQLSWQTVLMREGIGRFILSFPGLGLLGYLPIIGSKKKQQIGDYISQTSVISLATLSAFTHQQEVLSAPETAHIHIGKSMHNE